jgi:predicted phage terminase large subunit-like protein
LKVLTQERITKRTGNCVQGNTEIAVATDEEAYYRRLVAKVKCEEDHLFFTRFFFKARMNQKFLVNWHHRLIADVVDDVFAGRRKNVVINVAPGGTKTELVVINFIARGLALNPWSRFLHLSGSDNLASLNSSTAREIVLSDEFQNLWPLRIATDVKAKKRWNVMVDNKIAGGVYATAIGGQVTGFRAGHMAEGFQGAILIDDPVKPEDAFQRSAVDEANRALITTVKSRRATPDTPIVLIMQRVAENDPSGFIERGSLEGKWDFVKIPALLTDEYVKTLGEKYQKLIGAMKAESEIEDGQYSYWPYKEPVRQLLEMRKGGGTDQKGQRISRHVYSSQYDQNPRALGGNIIKGADFERYRILPKLKYRKVFCDTAQKTKERNDFSVFEEWGLTVDGKIALVDLERGRWEAPELQRRAVAFWAKAKARNVDTHGALREMLVEDKASGTGLIQTIKLPPYNIPVKGIERSTDKYQRVNDALPYIEAHLVMVPEEAPYTSDFIVENEAFSADDSHDFDDQIDPEVDAIMDMLQSGNKIRQWEQLGKKG